MLETLYRKLCKPMMAVMTVALAVALAAGCSGNANSEGEGESDSGEDASAVTIPVSDFSDLRYTSREATFGWSAVMGANTVRIEQSPLDADEWTPSRTGTIAVNMASATVAGLEPDTSYKFRLVVTGGDNAGESNIASLTTMPTYQVTYSASVGGVIAGEAKQTVDYAASSKIVTALEEDGYKFVQWSDGSTDATRTDKDVVANLNISAEFEVGESVGTPIADFADVVYLSRQATFSWTAPVNAATVQIEQSPLHQDAWTSANTGAIPVNATSATVTGLNPNTEYKFRLVVTGGINKGPSNVISFTMMPTYKLSYSAGAGGSLSGETEQTVDYRGRGKAVTAAPDAGYRFVQWSDGRAGELRTDIDVTDELSVEAEFAKN